MEITLCLFGQIAEIIGYSSNNISMKENTDVLAQWLKKQYPELENRSFIMAVNEQMITETTVLKAGDKIAILPPFSGG